jgi:hypothetical protein
LITYKQIIIDRQDGRPQSFEFLNCKKYRKLSYIISTNIVPGCMMDVPIRAPARSTLK